MLTGTTDKSFFYLLFENATLYDTISNKMEHFVLQFEIESDWTSMQNNPKWSVRVSDLKTL